MKKQRTVYMFILSGFFVTCLGCGWSLDGSRANPWIGKLQPVLLEGLGEPDATDLLTSGEWRLLWDKGKGCIVTAITTSHARISSTQTSGCEGTPYDVYSDHRIGQDKKQRTS